MEVKGGDNINNMMMRRDFHLISEEFKTENFTLQTVSRLIEQIRLYKNNLTKEQAVLLLEIPISILENDVEIMGSGRWSKTNGHYFSGNITWVNSDYFTKLKEKFASCKFGLEDIIDLARQVRDNFEELSSASDFLLRNVEVTLRDDVKLIAGSTFEKSGKVFAENIDKAIQI